jgi:hypothetical protein
MINCFREQISRLRKDRAEELLNHCNVHGSICLATMCHMQAGVRWVPIGCKFIQVSIAIVHLALAWILYPYLRKSCCSCIYNEMIYYRYSSHFSSNKLFFAMVDFDEGPDVFQVGTLNWIYNWRLTHLGFTRKKI